MAIYHCSVKIIGRNSGRTSVGASAYRSGTKMKNERDGVVHDYTNKGGVMYSEVILPDDAPRELCDRSRLWNAVEHVENANNSQLAREIEIALPKEFSLEENIRLTKEFASNFVKEGMCVDFAIHDKGDGNPHAHIMTTMRPLQNGNWVAKSQKEYICKNSIGETRKFTAEELKLCNDFEKLYKYSLDGSDVWMTKTEAGLHENCKRLSKNPKCSMYGRRDSKLEKWNSEEYINEIREGWANIVNRYLELKGINEKVDHRSYIEQGKVQEPMQHLGVSTFQMEKRGKVTERGNINRKIIRNNLIKGVIEIDKDKGKGFEHWAKIYNLKQEAKSFFLLSENKGKIEQLKTHMKVLEDNIREKDNILKYVYTLRKYHQTYKQYESSKNKGSFYKQNERELNIYNTAKGQLKKILGEGTKVNNQVIENLKIEIADLRTEKSSLYIEYKKTLSELQNYQIAQGNLQKIFNNNIENRNEKSNIKEKE